MTDALVEAVARAIAGRSGFIFTGESILDHAKVNPKSAGFVVLARAAIAAIEAQGWVLVPKCDPFRNADAKDWEQLFKMLPDSGHGKFWKAVLREVQTEISARPIRRTPDA